MGPNVSIAVGPNQVVKRTEQVIELLLWFGVLGIYVSEDEERYSYQYEHDPKRMSAGLRALPIASTRRFESLWDAATDGKTPATVVQKASRTYETPEPTQTPPAAKSPVKSAS